jgi:predicted permease
MSWILRDAYFAVRAWRRRPTLASIAIATIAIGIGAATSVFSVVDGVLLRPLAFAQPNRLIAIWQTFPDWKKNEILASSWDQITLSQPEFRDLRATQTSFTDVGIWSGGRALLTVGDRTEPVRTVRASSSLLGTLGVAPLLGRTFLPDEDTPTGPPAALMSFELWQSRFGGDAGIVGRVVSLDDVPFTVVGVLPPGLKLGRTTSTPVPDASAEVAFWTPVGRDSQNYSERTNHSYRAVGRLKPGITLERAAAEVAQLLRPTPGEAREKGTRLAEWQVDQTASVRAPLFILLTAAGLLLLIACVNVATLLLGEAATRELEMAARLALGAARSRIVWQLLIESVLLAMAGSAIGALLSWWGTHALVAAAPPRIPGLTDVRVDLRVLGASLAASLATGVLFGLAPALTLSSARPGVLLRAGGQSARGRGALQRTLIAVELGLSVILLVGAGLLARTLQRITDVDPGFRSANLIVDQPSLSRATSSDSLVTRQFNADVVTRLAALPGVTGVTAASAPPFSNNSTSSSFQIEGEPQPATGGGVAINERRHSAQQRVTLPGYFAMLGIPVRVGRDFSVDDRASTPFVCIVSAALARRDFPNESPIGRRVKYQGYWRTVIGVVDDVHLQRLSSDYEATIYTPLEQRWGAWVLSLFVRTAGDPGSMMSAVRKTVADAAPRQTTQSMETMESMMRRSFAEERYRALLISLFGVFAAVLAAVGMYGVTTRAVARRTRELAIRSALGATASAIARTVLGGTLTGGAIGVSVGLFVAALTARQLAPYLFGVSTTDPITYAAIIALLVAVSLGATWLPARRAARADVAEVLRGE